jgi:hypothetical protein
MNNEDIKLLLMDLSARLTYGVKIQKINEPESAYRLYSINTNTGELKFTTFEGNSLSMGDGGYLARVGKLRFKPYLRSLSSMTEEEAKVLGTLHDIKDILSVKVTNEYIDYIVDDGFSSTFITTLWCDELISSVECLDWLNSKHFDYRGLILKGLAIAVTDENNPYK